MEAGSRPKYGVFSVSSVFLFYWCMWKGYILTYTLSMKTYNPSDNLFPNFSPSFSPVSAGLGMSWASITPVCGVVA